MNFWVLLMSCAALENSYSVLMWQNRSFSVVALCPSPANTPVWASGHVQRHALPQAGWPVPLIGPSCVCAL